MDKSKIPPGPYIFFVKHEVVGSDKDIDLVCMCRTRNVWHPPHKASDLFCSGCGSEFIVKTLRGEGGYFFTDKGPMKIVGADVPEINDLPKEQRENLFKFWREALDLLKRPEVAANDLDKLRNIAQRASQQNTSGSEVSAEIAASVPSAAPIAQYLQNSANVATLLALLLSIIAFVQQMRSQSVSPITVINQTTNQVTISQPLSSNRPQKPKKPKASKAYKNKIGRGAPCPCQSGKTYSKCHGRNK